jgi:hypothetical protein
MSRSLRRPGIFPGGQVFPILGVGGTPPNVDAIISLDPIVRPLVQSVQPRPIPPGHLSATN